MQKTDLMEKTLMLGRTKDQKNKKTTENEISRQRYGFTGHE